MVKFTRFILKYAGWISFLGTALAAVMAYYSVLLYMNLRTDIEELLPTTARSVIDLKEVSERLQSVNNLTVLIFGDDPNKSRKFVDDFAKRISQEPKDIIANVEYKISEELAFFEQRKALYIETKDLSKIRDYIQQKIKYERQLYNPLNIISDEEIPEPVFDFDALRKKYESKVSSYARFPDGHYATPDGKIRAVLIHMPGSISGISNAKKLRHKIDEIIAELNPASYDPSLKLEFTGGVQDLLEEHAALLADLELSTIVTMALCGIAMLLFYRAFRPTAVLFISLLMGVLWTFGAAYFAVGYLNANSAFLGSIVIGNGINFGVIFLARYIEERRNQISHTRALYKAVQTTAGGTWTAALAAGLAYGSLMLTGFRGFNQFGLIGLMGMLLCWLSTFTLLPAFLTVLYRYGFLTKKFKKPTPIFAGAIAKVIQKFPGTIVLCTLALTVASVSTFSQIDYHIIESDLGKLRDKASQEKGSAYLSKYVDQIFQRYLSPIVVLAKDQKEAATIAEALKAYKNREGVKSAMANIVSVHDFIPPDQETKIQLLREIQELLPEQIFQKLPTKEQTLVREFLNPAVFRPIQAADLPPLILTKFTEKNGVMGTLVLVEPPLDGATKDGPTLIKLVHTIRDIADGIHPGVPVAGQLPVSADMIESILEDGPKATAFAFAAVIVLVIILFRRLSTILLCLTALVVGVIWMFGYLFVTDLKINFLNFIALPITFGIGVDYGVNIFQRYLQEGPGKIIKVIRHTAGAICLASLTTIIGYSSLLIAGNQAFVSFGKLAVLGEITCLIGAVVSLPAFLEWNRQRKTKKRKPKEV